MVKYLWPSLLLLFLIWNSTSLLKMLQYLLDSPVWYTSISWDILLGKVCREPDDNSLDVTRDCFTFHHECPLLSIQLSCHCNKIPMKLSMQISWTPKHVATKLGLLQNAWISQSKSILPLFMSFGSDFGKLWLFQFVWVFFGKFWCMPTYPKRAVTICKLHVQSWWTLAIEWNITSLTVFLCLPFQNLGTVKWSSGSTGWLDLRESSSLDFSLNQCSQIWVCSKEGPGNFWGRDLPCW